MSPPALSELAGIGEAVARKAIQAARSMMKLGFMDGRNLLKRESVGYITTGSKNLDTLLGGKGVSRSYDRGLWGFWFWKIAARVFSCI